tara:strand:- start:235 stop:825 length:591 start_codon:yes stop_codon:yes gene_type:complete
MGNVFSVLGAFERLGVNAKITKSVDDLNSADGLVLPGVGAFGDGIKNIEKFLNKKHLDELVLKKKKPILGICLGMQLFATFGTEFGKHNGLGWVPGKVVKLMPGHGLKVPHVGWDDIKIKFDDPVFKGIKKKLFYFVHSYKFQTDDPDHVLATCTYGEEHVASVRNDNIIGMQFHPEKSQKEGLLLLENYLRICNC